jgi:hypothetical protein
LLYAYAFDLVVAFIARGCDESFEAVFTIKLSFLFDETDILKRATTLSVDADEMIRAPDLAQGSDEGSPKIYYIRSYLLIRN